MRRNFAPVEVGRGTGERGDETGVLVRAGGAHDPGSLPLPAEDGTAEPTAALLSGRAPRSSAESDRRAGYDGAKRKKGPRSSRRASTRPSSGTAPAGWRRFEGTLPA